MACEGGFITETRGEEVFLEDMREKGIKTELKSANAMTTFCLFFFGKAKHLAQTIPFEQRETGREKNTTRTSAHFLLFDRE